MPRNRNKGGECLLLIKDNSLESLRILRFIDNNLSEVRAAGLHIKILLIKAATLDQEMVDMLRKNGFDTFPTFVPCEPGLKDSPLNTFDSIKKYLLGHTKRAELMRVGNNGRYDNHNNINLKDITPEYATTGGRMGPSIRSGGRISDYESYQEHQIMAEGGLGKVDDDPGIGEDDFGRRHQEKMTSMQERRIRPNPANRRPGNALNNMMMNHMGGGGGNGNNSGGNTNKTLGQGAPFSMPNARGLSIEDELEEDNIKYDKISNQLLDKNEGYNDEDIDMKQMLLDTPID